jgi:hypothetical protein
VLLAIGTRGPRAPGSGSEIFAEVREVVGIEPTTIPSSVFACQKVRGYTPQLRVWRKFLSALCFQRFAIIKHTFSAFWLRSSVVSVLISLISDTLGNA